MEAEGVWFLPQSKKNMRGFCLNTWKNVNATLGLCPPLPSVWKVTSQEMLFYHQEANIKWSDTQTIVNYQGLAKISDTGRFYKKEMTQTSL